MSQLQFKLTPQLLYDIRRVLWTKFPGTSWTVSVLDDDPDTGAVRLKVRGAGFTPKLLKSLETTSTVRSVVERCVADRVDEVFYGLFSLSLDVVAITLEP